MPQPTTRSTIRNPSNKENTPQVASPHLAVTMNKDKPTTPTPNSPATLDHDSNPPSFPSSVDSLFSKDTQHTAPDTTTTLNPTTQAIVVLANKARSLAERQETDLKSLIEPHMKSTDIAIETLNKQLLA